MHKILCLLVGGCIFLTGCGKCCEVSRPSPSSSTSTSTASEDLSCCDVEPSRAALLAQSGQAPGVDLKVVKLNEVLEAVKAQSGKIVVLDVWATFCVPCKKEFPRLVKLHEQHAKDGLVCMSLCVDERDDRPLALDFLVSRRAAFANFLIDERAAVWQNHFAVKGVPAVFIWDRSGHQVARFDGDDPDNQFTYGQVEAKIADLLKVK